MDLRLGITDPRDVNLPQDVAMPGSDGRDQPETLDQLNIAPGQLPQYGLPGMIFGANFQWNFNPLSDGAATIWSLMPAQSWLDTADGWNTMLRPESPKSTEGDHSVDSHAVQLVPKTASVASLNMDEYVEKDGRKYHKYHEGKYYLPNDELEQDRLDLQHAAVTMLFHGKLSLAPINSLKRALDLATGTGIWAIQFAEKNPDTTVIGTDLSPIQPDAKPRNCRFWIEDSEDPWHFEVPFDYIHARFVCSCYNDPRRVIQQAYDNLKPGGWIEFQDADPIMRSDDGTLDGTALDRLFHLFVAGIKTLGRDIRVSQYYKQWMIEAGFEDVTEGKFKLPGNTWPKDPYAKQIGKYQAANCRDGIDGVSRIALKKGLGVTEEERAALTKQAKLDCTNPDVHWYEKIFVVYGRKPADLVDTPNISSAPGIPTSLAGIATSFY